MLRLVVNHSIIYFKNSHLKWHLTKYRIQGLSGIEPEFSGDMHNMLPPKYH